MSVESSEKPPRRAMAVVLEEPRRLGLREVALTEPGDDDVIVALDWSGISTGTERLLWSGRMPSFPGMGYPLVPGYESVGRITHSGPASGRRVGETVFVPGASCYQDVRGLFGGASANVVVPGARTVVLEGGLGERSTLLALAATAHHALRPVFQLGSASAANGGTSRPVARGRGPTLIVGHGALGRLLARLTLIFDDEAPIVWETNAARATGATGYRVCHPEDDDLRAYPTIIDASGDAGLLDSLIGRLAPHGEIVLAGFYAEDVSFAFPPAFMREARFRIAAEWQPEDMQAVVREVESGRLDLDGLISHRSPIADAKSAYETAFEDPTCLKMILDWRSVS